MSMSIDDRIERKITNASASSANLAAVDSKLTNWANDPSERIKDLLSQLKTNLGDSFKDISDTVKSLKESSNIEQQSATRMLEIGFSTNEKLRASFFYVSDNLGDIRNTLYSAKERDSTLSASGKENMLSAAREVETFVKNNMPFFNAQPLKDMKANADSVCNVARDLRVTNHNSSTTQESQKFKTRLTQGM